jgi:hypothetical protein
MSLYDTTSTYFDSPTTICSNSLIYASNELKTPLSRFKYNAEHSNSLPASPTFIKPKKNLFSNQYFNYSVPSSPTNFRFNLLRSPLGSPSTNFNKLNLSGSSYFENETKNTASISVNIFKSFSLFRSYFVHGLKTTLLA